MQPVLPDSTDITPLLWHAIGIREVTSTFLTLWPRLSTWTPTSPLVDADESLARFAAEHGHPVVVKFLEDQATATKTVKEFLRFLSGKSIEVGDETQTVLEIAMTSQFPDVKTWAQSYGTLQPRKGCGKCYRIVGQKVHGSETCIVIIAEDVQSKDHIALKLMANKDEWEREKSMRLMDDGQQLDAKHVVNILDDFALDDEAMSFCASHKELRGNSKPVPAELLDLKADLSSAISTTTLELENQLKSFDKDKDGTIDHQEFRTGMRGLAPEITDDQVIHLLTLLDKAKDGTVDYKEFARMFGRYPYPCMVTMPAAAMDFTYVLSHDRIAGNDLEGVVDIMRQIGEHVKYMHEMLGRLHGDLKPRP